MIAYKLFALHRDGTIGPLFINRRMRLEGGRWYDAEPHPTKGFAFRPGWHCCSEPIAPHLSKRGRIWCEVEIEDATKHMRPAAQGGLWYTANRLKVLRRL